jgi:hypothetical protein
MKFYYILFSDAINKILTVEKSKDMWKFYTLIFISFAMGFNLFMLSFILHDLNILKIETIKVKLNTTGIYKLDSFLSYAVVYLFPFLMLNYFLIFYKEKYKQIIIKYKHYDGKLIGWYYAISFFSFPLFFIIGAVKYYLFR